LKYMSDEERNISIPGYVKPDTIWGFEEPENNLELRYAFELAESFQKYSKDIQIFLTTHSPAFYALDKTETDKVKTFFVSQDNTGCTNLKTVSKNETDDIHEQMGLLPIITPYLTKIIEKEAEIESHKKIIESLQDNIKCIVLTEDEDFGAIQTIFSSSGFNLVETEFISYKGANNLAAIRIVAKHYLTTKPHLKVVIHRDRDYLAEDEFNKEKQDVEAIKCHFFSGDGVDVENEFLNPSHINFLYPKISKEQAQEIIFESTTSVEKDSKSRLIDKGLLAVKQGHSKKIEELYKLYDGDTKRYRYGKKVLSAVATRIQKFNGANANLLRKSEFLSNAQLTQLADKIWPLK
jgi:AAA domain, putative AbiEii toxin, Type IV TA system